MNTLVSLRPNNRPTVMKLLGAVGFDTSDWRKFRGKAPASNPKYCYEWAFEQEKRPPVINLPYEEMEEPPELPGQVVFKLDLHELSSGYGAKPARKKRMKNLARVLKRAHAERLAVRVIAFVGALGDKDESAGHATRVTARRLDELPWTVTAYDTKLGQCVLTRCRFAQAYVDQFSVLSRAHEPVQRRDIAATTFVRSSTVRQRALERAAGFCQFCGKPGFAMSNGAVYLETHHVLPLSEGGSDTDSNIVALCANHHREVHHGADATAMRVALVALASGGADHL